MRWSLQATAGAHDEDEKEFKRVANAAFLLLKERPAYVTQVCEDYSENVWTTRRGLVFKKREEVSEAKRYTSFLKAIGIDEQRIELAFYKEAKSDQIKFWRSSLGLKSCVETFGLSPQNINSPGTLDAVRVKVGVRDSKGLPDGSEAPYLRLLMFLLGFVGVVKHFVTTQLSRFSLFNHFMLARYRVS